MNRFVVFAVAWWLLSAYGFFMRPPSIAVPLFPHFDKFTHFVLFFGQLWLIARAYALNHRLLPRLMWLSWALLWAIVIEWIQSFLPNRSADVADIIADILGAGCAVWLAQTFFYQRLSVKDSES